MIIWSRELINNLLDLQNSYSCLSGKGQGKPNKTAVHADTVNDTNLIHHQHELHGILYMLKVTGNIGREKDQGEWEQYLLASALG